MSCFIYLLGIRNADSCQAPLKIGITSQPSVRFGELSRNCPYPLDIISILYANDRNTAMCVERSFKRKMRGFRRKGEWFDVGVLDAAKALIAAADDNKVSNKINTLGMGMVATHDGEGISYRDFQ